MDSRMNIPGIYAVHVFGDSEENDDDQAEDEDYIDDNDYSQNWVDVKPSTNDFQLIGF